MHDNSHGTHLTVTVMTKEKYSGFQVVPDNPKMAKWITNTDDDLRSIPAFERKKWFLDANECKVG